jgi:hypothetical protein
MNGLPAMKNPDALRIFFPEYFRNHICNFVKDKVKSVKNTGVSQPR